MSYYPLMKNVLNTVYGLNIQDIAPFSRKDIGNDNDLFRVTDKQNEYFLKEIPGHSKRDDLELIYSELSKCHLSKSKMILPIKSLEQKYLVCINNKDLMLYDYIEHNVFNEVDIEIDRLLDILEDLFIGFEKIAIPKHPFKTYNNWFERGVSLLRKKIENHKFLNLYDNYVKTRFTELDFEIGNTHFDLNPFNIWLDDKENILIADFDNAQIAAYAKDIFDVCSRYVNVLDDGVTVPEFELSRILDFSKKYIKNIEARDIKFLLVRPKLGSLFDPKVDYSEDELIKKMDHFYEFCSTL